MVGVAITTESPSLRKPQKYWETTRCRSYKMFFQTVTIASLDNVTQTHQHDKKENVITSVRKKQQITALSSNDRTSLQNRARIK